MKSRKFSRRRFLTVGSFSLVGAWAGFSDQLAPRMVREFLAETVRGVLVPEHLPNPRLWDPNRITAAWLGHASVLLNFFGVTILTDPALCNRIGADTWWGTFGPKRLIAPALKPKSLPPVDLVLLSHAHMDHFDFATIRCLPGGTRAVTARATADLLRNTPLRGARELGWGEGTRVETAHGEVDITAFEVNHWGSRWKYDRERGYNGYILSRGGRKLIFGGDTAMTDSFRGLRGKGPFDAAIMPIGAYKPWIFAHCSPEQAVRMADAAGAEHFLPMHFKTFPFGREGTVEPVERMDAAIAFDRIGWREVGQTFSLS